MKLARGLLVVVILLDITEGVSMVRRGSRHESDLGVFHRAAVAVQEGARGDLYRRPVGDEGWLFCLPPVGILLLYPGAGSGPVAWSILWLVENVIFLAVALWCLERLIVGRADRKSPPTTRVERRTASTSTRRRSA